jgi:hypothetical protein
MARISANQSAHAIGVNPSTIMKHLTDAQISGAPIILGFLVIPICDPLAQNEANVAFLITE